MSITFQPEPTDRGDGTWDMHRGAPSLNVSGANAALILDRLGVEYDSCGSIDAGDLLGRALVGNVGRDDTATPWAEDATPGLMPLVDCGNRAGYFEDRLAELVEVARAAQVLGVAVQWA